VEINDGAQKQKKKSERERDRERERESESEREREESKRSHYVSLPVSCINYLRLLMFRQG